MPNETQDTLTRTFALAPVDLRIDILQADIHKLQALLESAKAKLAIEVDIWNALEKMPNDQGDPDEKREDCNNNK